MDRWGGGWAGVNCGLWAGVGWDGMWAGVEYGLWLNVGWGGLWAWVGWGGMFAEGWGGMWVVGVLRVGVGCGRSGKQNPLRAGLLGLLRLLSVVVVDFLLLLLL